VHRKKWIEGWEDEDWSMREPMALKRAVLQKVMPMEKHIQKCKRKKEQ
jgi:hypothetical protein